MTTDEDYESWVRRQPTRLERGLLLWPYALTLLIALGTPVWILAGGARRSDWLMFAGAAAYPLLLCYTAVLLFSLPIRMSLGTRAVTGYCGTGLATLACWIVPLQASGFFNPKNIAELIFWLSAFLQSGWMELWGG